MAVDKAAHNIYKGVAGEKQNVNGKSRNKGFK